jgi:orotidine-5'-phosphate decarboxylase
MKEDRRPEDCLIVAADYRPEGKVNFRREVSDKVLALADQLKGLGVYIKVNSILRACGYDLIADLHGMGLRVFADLKLTDIPQTMETDAILLAEYRPDILTVMCNFSVEGMARVKNALRDVNTQILGVTIMTSLDEEECQQIYICTPKAGVVRFARLAQAAHLDGLIMSIKEAEVITKRKDLHLSINTPGIRPDWAVVKNDDQKRTGGIKDAFKKGVSAIVMGRPIVEAPNPREAVEKTLTEIKEGLEEKEEKAI